MRVAKWGNSLAARLPDAIVTALQLKAGDQRSIRADALLAEGGVIGV